LLAGVARGLLRSQLQSSHSPSTSFAAIRPLAKSIAVLPFESLTDNRNDTYFADGVQDEILSNLAKMSELKVISRTSVMGYRPGGNRNLRSIAVALGVAHVVEGTVRRDIAIAERSLPNSPDVLALKAYIDGRQGRWEDSLKGLQKARTLDPRNSSILNNLEFNYVYLRRYRDAEETCNRLLELEPDNAILSVKKAYCAFAEKADLSTYRAASEGLPASIKHNIAFTSQRIFYAAFARDWTTAREILSSTSNKELSFFRETIIPRGCVELWLAKVSGDHPWTEARFSAIRSTSMFIPPSADFEIVDYEFYSRLTDPAYADRLVKSKRPRRA
jgi:tetratricopeptide (TPR) repeat protein